jgi:RNA polymerase sigma factor (TIGR02999 family)
MWGESSAQTLQPTALVHEAWLRLSRTGDRRWKDRTHFCRVAAQAMRRILVDHSRQKASVKRGQKPEKLQLDDLNMVTVDQDDRILLIDEALKRLEVENPDGARIVTLKFFGGFTNREIGRTLQLTERTIERQWSHARARLFQMISSSV